MTLIPSFVKIGQLVQELKRAQTQANAGRALFTGHHRISSHSYLLTVYIEESVCHLKSFVVFPATPNEF
jgi:hypothetical protein